MVGQMAEKIQIDKLVLIERILIPMQNISLGLGFIDNEQNQLSPEAFQQGLSKVKANAEKIAQYVTTLKDGYREESTLRLPEIIQAFADESIRLNSKKPILETSRGNRPERAIPANLRNM